MRVGGDVSQPMAAAERICSVCAAAKDVTGFSKSAWRKEGDVCCRACNAAKHGDFRPPIKRNANRLASGERVNPNNWGYCTYLDILFQKRCFGDIAATGALSSAKDVSESMAALAAVKRHSSVAWSDASAVLLCVGDGAAPRTGAIAAFLTRWRVISIDPALGEEWVGEEPRGVARLTGFRGTVDEWSADAAAGGVDPAGRLVICLVHSHARLVGPSAVPRLREYFGSAPTVVVALPCCNRVRPARDVGSKPDVSYYDEGVFSDKRRVELWNFD